MLNPVSRPHGLHPAAAAVAAEVEEIPPPVSNRYFRSAPPTVAVTTHLVRHGSSVMTAVGAAL
jgi:hypothetical protein